MSSTVASLAMTAYLQRRMRSSRQHDLNGFRLTKPREQVLSLVAEYFCLRTGDFYGLIPNGTNNATAHERTIRRVLHDLYNRKLLSRLPLAQLDETRRFLTSSYIYGFSDKGLALARDEGLDSGIGKTFEEQSPRTLEHEVEISLFHIELKRFCEGNGLILYWRRKDLKKTVYPDALFAIADPSKPEEHNTFYYFLEVERSKRGNYANGEPQILRKLAAYSSYYGSARCTKDWDDFQHFRVILILRNEERSRNLLQLLAETHRRSMFWVTREDLYKQDISAKIFQTPRDYLDGALYGFLG